jgi:acetoacetyl-CoA synthetase
MDVDVVDESGTAVGVGETGELVCRTTFPSVPLGFWGDDGTRFHDAYFARIPGVWTHGDFITRTESGGFVIHGRSDATLNAGGIRMGTAEFYPVVNDFPWVADCVVVGVKEGLDEVVALFVVLHEGEELTTERVGEVRAALRERRSPRHVPAIVELVPDVPRTRSGKLAELAVADAVNGRPVRDLSGVANPESLEAFTRWSRGRTGGPDRAAKGGDSR